MTDRERQIRAFLASAGWEAAKPTLLAGDASFRRYYRVNGGARSAVLMDAPPDKEDTRPFVRVARHLAALGLSAPTLFAADEDLGLLLLEDFGDDTYTRLLQAGADEESLYALAVDVLLLLHDLPQNKAIPDGLPDYDRPRLLGEALLLADWYVPAVRGAPMPAAEREAYIAAWEATLPLVEAVRPTLVLRDFHVDNLMRIPGRSGVAACGLLDFQDAVAGPAAYDLMSLLEDARRDVSPAVKQAMLRRYLDTARPDDGEAFLAAFAVLAAQRHAKVIGIFTRLLHRDGKPAYLVHIPRVWRLLTQALTHPALSPVAEWFDRYLPAEQRRMPEA